jgi:capsular polysaccharide biosynthesis protein
MLVTARLLANQKAMQMTLIELLNLLKKHMRLVVVLPVACALAVAAYSVIFMRNVYTATTSMYVLVKNDSQNSNSNNLANELSASQMVTNDVAKLLKSDRVLKETAADLGIESLKAYKVSVGNETTSRVITLSVTGQDPQVAADFANKMVSNVSNTARKVMDIESVNVIDEASAPTGPSGPRRLLYTVVGLLAGLFAAVAIVVVADMLNTRIRNQEDLEQVIDVPVLGRIPAMKGGR